MSLTHSAIEQRAPLMLWCSSHTTLAAEEIPMFLEAGYRVVPLLTDFWTFEYKPEIDSQICDAWKSSVDLPADIVNRLQAIRFCANMGQNELSTDEIDLLNEHVDAIYVTVLPNLAMKLSNVFKGTVMFRPFGHGHLNTYTRIAEHLGGNLAAFGKRNNYMWVPILSTLSEPEDQRLCANANHLGAFVTPGRLGSCRWSVEQSQPYVVETIPRIQKQTYYMDIYKQYREDYRDLPVKILGGNPVAGGALNDPAIVGFLDDETYFRTAAEARVSIYHGMSRFHVHYHPIEFMAVGVPVLFHQDSAFAAEGMHFGMTRTDLEDAGMYCSVAQANDMARAALADAQVAQAWSVKQRFFLDEVFNRKKVLDQARWIKRRIAQQRPWTEKQFDTHIEDATSAPQATVPVLVGTESTTKTKRPLTHRVYREFKRVIHRTRGRYVAKNSA